LPLLKFQPSYLYLTLYEIVTLHLGTCFSVILLNIGQVGTSSRIHSMCDLYLGGASFRFRLTLLLSSPRFFYKISQPFNKNACTSTQIRPQPLPSTSFTIHYSMIIVTVYPVCSLSSCGHKVDHE